MARKPRWEDSAADKRADRAGAKKSGMSVAKYERSAEDKRKDAVAQRKMDKKGRK